MKSAHDYVDEIVARLNADLAADEEAAAQYAIGFHAGWGFTVDDKQGNVLGGIGGDDSAPATAAEAEEWLAFAASYLQDHVMDLLYRAWPKCPNHEHPLVPVVVEGAAVWRCKSQPDRHWPIGRLERHRHPRSST